MFTYLAYGLGITSEIELPELTTPGGAETDITIVNGKLSERFAEPNTDSFRCKVTDDGVYLNWREIGIFFVSDSGSEIVCCGLADADPAYLRLAILGPVIAIALHNQGYLVLHASACLIGQSLCLFIGPSGAGKSTMLACLQQRGHRALCDDIVAINVREDDALVFPGVSRLKLWPDSLEPNGISSAIAEPLYDGFDKFSIPFPLSSGQPSVPHQIRYIFWLRSAKKIQIIPLSKMDSLLSLLTNCYVDMMDKRLSKKRAKQEFMQCSKLFGLTETLMLTRPANLAQLSTVAECIERFVGGSEPT